MRSKTRKFIALLFSFAAIYLVLIFVLPLITKIPYMKEMQACIQKWDINTTAFFYTDEISSKEEITDITDL